MSVRPFHCAALPGNLNGRPSLLADRSIGGERRAHVHRVADRLANDRMRPVHAPGEAVAPRGGVHFVFLVVVEVRDVETRLLLAHRGRRKEPASRVGLERSKVVLKPGDERDMLDASRRRERVEHGADDPGIDPDVLFFGRPARPDGQIDVARLQPAHRLGHACGVVQVGGDMLDARRRSLPGDAKRHGRGRRRGGVPGRPRARRCRSRRRPALRFPCSSPDPR